MSLKTSSSSKCLQCSQQQFSKPARRPHRTSSVASTFNADRRIVDPTQPTKTKKNLHPTRPYPTQAMGQPAQPMDKSGLFVALVCTVKMPQPVSGQSNKKLSYRRWTARCVVSVEILPVDTQQCRNYCTTSPEQIEVMKLEGQGKVNTTSYSTIIETMRPSCTVFKRKKMKISELFCLLAKCLVIFTIMYNESYLHVLTTLRIHSLRRKKILFYVRATIKNQSKT